VLLNSPADPIDPHTMPVPSHVVLNHLYVLGTGPPAAEKSSSISAGEGKTKGEGKTEEKGGGRSPRSHSSVVSDVLVTGITQKFKMKAFASLTPKFVTTVYYSPIDPGQLGVSRAHAVTESE